MSKVLTQQTALPIQQPKKVENHKKTTPTVQMLNSNCSGLNGSTTMRGTATNSVACSSESPSTSSSPITVDCDDFTSSSILEFLAREQECCTEADTESIFQEVSRLADNSDTRSVDEILREAELLMQQQSIFGCTDRTAQSKQLKVSGGNKTKSHQFVPPQIQQTSVATQNVKLNSKYTKRIENVSPLQKQIQTVPQTRLTNGNCSHKEKMIPQKNGSEYSAYAASDTTATNTPQTPTVATPIGNQRFDAFVENLPSVSVISEESTPKDMQNMMSTDADVTMALLNGDDDDTDTMEEITEGIENIDLILNDEGQPVEVNIVHTNGSNAVDEVPPNNFFNELEDDADDADADTLSADGSSLDANTAENAANTATTTTTFYTGHLSMSASSSVMSTSLHIAAQTKLKQSEDGGSNVVARRPSYDAMPQPSPQQLQTLPAAQPAHSVNYAPTQAVTQLVGGSPARRNPLNVGGMQHSSPSMLERRSSGGYCAVAQRSSMTTPDSGISQTQSSQSCTPGPYSPHRMLATPLPAKTYCDKSVNSSPKRMISALTSPIEPFAANVGREHALKHEIELLQEKLKDTEERLQSLRIQHDSLSQLHRDLRESNTKLQEESEMLKLDVQHLNECANILRTELQTARADRDEALHLQKTLQGELEENRQERKRTQEQKDKDAKTIQDLQRQCREMERILMRKHPDSVSALIVASKNSGKCASNDQENVNSRKLLEQRIAQLESDAKEQDLKAQQILANVQARFNSVQSKYETHIADLETQVLSLQEINTKLNEKIESQVRTLDYFVSKKAETFYNNCTQTDANVVVAEHEAGCSSDVTKRASANTTGDKGNVCANNSATSNNPNANANNNHNTNTTGTQTVQTKSTRDHSTNTIGTSSAVHSASSSTSSTANSTPNTSRPNSKQSGIRKPFATAMGTLSSALASKLPVSHSDLTISAHHAHASAKEDAHLLATIRGMRVDLAIKDKAMQRLTRELEECKKTIKKLQREKEAQKSDKSQWNSYTCLNIARRSHEALHHNQAHSDQMPATTESQTLREAQNKLKLLESDYKILHDKRLNDLKTLQSAHERELASCHETVRVLQQRLNERDEAFATQKRRKLPVDYYALKAKVSSLERRHSEREERLRMLVDALSKGRLTGAIEDLLGDNNNQRST